MLRLCRVIIDVLDGGVEEVEVVGVVSVEGLWQLLHEYLILHLIRILKLTISHIPCHNEIPYYNIIPIIIITDNNIIDD